LTTATAPRRPAAQTPPTAPELTFVNLLTRAVAPLPWQPALTTARHHKRSELELHPVTGFVMSFMAGAASERIAALVAEADKAARARLQRVRDAFLTSDIYSRYRETVLRHASLKNKTHLIDAAPGEALSEAGRLLAQGKSAEAAQEKHTAALWAKAAHEEALKVAAELESRTRLSARDTLRNLLAAERAVIAAAHETNARKLAEELTAAVQARVVAFVTAQTMCGRCSPDVNLATEWGAKSSEGIIGMLGELPTPVVPPVWQQG
jgi:hypothetical protein